MFRIINPIIRTSRASRRNMGMLARNAEALETKYSNINKNFKKAASDLNKETVGLNLYQEVALGIGLFTVPGGAIYGATVECPNRDAGIIEHTMWTGLTITYGTLMGGLAAFLWPIIPVALPAALYKSKRSRYY